MRGESSRSSLRLSAWLRTCRKRSHAPAVTFSVSSWQRNRLFRDCVWNRERRRREERLTPSEGKAPKFTLGVGNARTTPASSPLRLNPEP
jgi:hypothetical protein